jgi:hypothetical protein
MNRRFSAHASDKLILNKTAAPNSAAPSARLANLSAAFEAEIAARRAALLAELEELERTVITEPPPERAARVAELKHRKRI